MNADERHPETLRRLNLAISAARAAGDLALEEFKATNLEVETKSDGTPVTIADRAAERLIRDRIDAGAPDDAIVGEEYGSTAGNSGWTWYVDPIDGTQAFVRGVPLFGTMIGAETDDRKVNIGVVYFPALAEIYWAASELGAWWQPRLSKRAKDPIPPRRLRRATVSTVSDLSSAQLTTTSFKRLRDDIGPERFGRLLDAFRQDRGWGDCFGHVLVATGRGDAMVDPEMNVWDCAALKPIVEEAGGRFTDLKGNATIHGGSAVSSNGLLHDRVLALLQGHD